MSDEENAPVTWRPTYATASQTDHHRDVHVTQDTTLLDEGAWDGVRKPDVVIYAPEGLNADSRALVFDGDDPVQELADHLDES